jgi:L-arabinose isomerase
MKVGRVRPKAGLLMMTAEWFAQIGAHGGSFQELPATLAQDGARIERALGGEMEVINPGPLAAVDQVDRALERFRAEDVDLIIACQITWGEDRLILRAVKELPSVPLLLWCYTPSRRLPEQLTMLDLFRFSGPVGALQASGPLKRLGKRFGFAFGAPEDDEAMHKIGAFARAAAVARSLRQATIGVLPYRCDQMTGTYVDEFRLRHELGPRLKYISTYDYLALCQSIPDREVGAYVQELRGKYRVAASVTAAGLSNAARASLGLARVAQTYDLDAVAIEDVSEELHRVVGLRPCLYVSTLFERAVVSMEAEVGGAVALLILRELTGRAPMYTEAFAVDPRENCILVGHAGIHDAPHLVERAEDILIEPDGEYLESEPDSAWMRFRAKGGQVTLLSVFMDVERFKLVIASGEALNGEPKLLGSPHAYVRLGTPLAGFFEQAIWTGMTQHWALVHDDVVDELLALAEVMDLDRVVI